MTKVLGYCRVSTENQNGADSFGLETQRDTITKHCASNGLELVQIFEDPALSGSLPPLERPGLHAVLETLKAGDIQQVIVTRLDRLARDTMLSLWLMKEIKKLGAELVSIAEPGRWEDPTQKLLLTMVAAFAEFEKSLISSRLSGGRKTKARQGGYAGGMAPIGYKAERGCKALIVDDEKVGTVRRVFELREAKPDASLQKLADLLNAEGLTTKEGRQFHPMQVKRILDRRAVYEGRYKYSGVEAEGQHQPILNLHVDRE
jgi:DNA invertase Pin-like site-specific DNA recombinase